MACNEDVPTAEEVWLEMAGVLAKRSRCSRRQIGALLVLNGQPVGWAHNGPQDESVRTSYHCPRGALTYAEQPKDTGYKETGCIELHAEELALSRATVQPRGATMYVNEEPCSRCQYAMRVCGVTWVVLGVAKTEDCV